MSRSDQVHPLEIGVVLVAGLTCVIAIPFVRGMLSIGFIRPAMACLGALIGWLALSRITSAFLLAVILINLLGGLASFDSPGEFWFSYSIVIGLTSATVASLISRNRPNASRFDLLLWSMVGGFFTLLATTMSFGGS